MNPAGRKKVKSATIIATSPTQGKGTLPVTGQDGLGPPQMTCEPASSGALLPPSPPADKATECRYGADLGPANMFNRQFGGRPSIAFTRHM